MCRFWKIASYSLNISVQSWLTCLWIFTSVQAKKPLHIHRWVLKRSWVLILKPRIAAYCKQSGNQRPLNWIQQASHHSLHLPCGYTGSQRPLRQKPGDVIKCCVFTLSQQDTDQRQQKAKLINTVPLWTHTADNQSAPLLWIRESVQRIKGGKKLTWLHIVQTRGRHSQVAFTFITRQASSRASRCHTGTHAGAQFLKPSIHHLRQFLSYFF